MLQTNDEAKWDWPDSYYSANDANDANFSPTVLQAIAYNDGKPTPLTIDALATKMAEKRTWEEDVTPIKARCFIFKNPMKGEEPTIVQDRENKHLWFSFIINIGVTHSSATAYMVVSTLFVIHVFKKKLAKLFTYHHDCRLSARVTCGLLPLAQIHRKLMPPLTWKYRSTIL